ncbi:ATP-dependent DNA helicase RecG [Hymenobacter psoromatis]|nr:ATP-dependent DNA helicase RecG [Hymenobacter psoromatis]
MLAALTKTDLLITIATGENSAVEFKRDDIRPEQLAKELVAFGNFEGGRVLLGVEDDGTVSGLRYSQERDAARVEEWVMTVCRTHVQPGIIPFFQIIRDVEPGRDVAVIQLNRAVQVLYAWHNQRRTYYVRAGTVSAEMDSYELARLFQQRGQVRADVQPVGGTSLADLDLGRLLDYFRRVRQQEDTPEADDAAGWTQLLLNTELMVELRDAVVPAGTLVCSLASLLLFGRNPNRFLPQAGITAVRYAGQEKEYATPQRFRGPLVALFQKDDSGQVEKLEDGVIDRALAFVQQHASDPEKLVGAVRTEQWHYPPEAVREAIVNAVAHRDYLLGATDIELAIYADRLEVISPGRLPNGITPARMRAGTRATRNQLVLDVLRDYRYMEHMGMGIRLKIIRLMREYNGTEPDLEVNEDRFTLRLWR